MAEIQPPENDLIVNIPTEAANENSLKIIREFREKLIDELTDLILNPPAPAVKLSAKEWHDKLMDNIADAYYIGPRSDAFMQGSWADFQQWGDSFYDSMGIQAEIELLMHDDLGDALQEGAIQPPRARPFVNYVSGLYLGAEIWGKLFRKWHKTYMDDEESQPQAQPVPEVGVY